MKRFLSTALILSTLASTAKAVNYEDLSQMIEEQQSYMDAAHTLAESARFLGYDEEHLIIQEAISKYNEAESLKQEYQRQLENYPVALFIWDYLKNLGYNDYVCAGILGNAMVETGGNTLDINSSLENKNYYGFLQWSKYWYPEVVGMTLEEQCNYLKNNIEYEMNTFGNCYKRGFTYSSFVELQNEKEAALAFAKVFERCSSASYEKRKKCATIAYNYFTNRGF